MILAHAAKDAKTVTAKNLNVLNELCVERTETEWAVLIRELVCRLEDSVGRPVTQGALLVDENRGLHCNCRIKFDSQDGEAKTHWEGVLYAGRTRSDHSASLIICFPFIQGVRVEPPDDREQFIEFQFTVDETVNGFWTCKGWVSDDSLEWRQITKPGDLYFD